jgi:uncharacterized hydrophobic protein (TIGR00271 family)
VPLTATDVTRMRDQLFFEGPEINRWLTRFWLLLPLAAVIATAGVVADSTATVIGAMIVAPLMVPILGTVLAVVLADRPNLARSLILLVSGITVVVAIGWLIGLTVDAPIVADTNSQVAGRVSPRLIDLIAALATGAVGAIALAREDISDTLPGVAISISLVPPLAVVGLTLESGAGDEALGALILFVTNVSAILTMGLLVMSVYRVRALAAPPLAGAKPINRRRAGIAIVAGLLVISIPLATTSFRIASSRSTETNVTRVAENWAARHGWTVVSVTTGPQGTQIRATGPMPEPETGTLRRALVAADLGDENISIQLIPSNTVDLTNPD